MIFGILQVAGLAVMMILAGINALAGLGGGGPHILILILFFGMDPKHATIVVFACIFGSACGNMINQMRRSLNGQPVVNYQFASLTIPLMFVGAIFGVIINQILPSIITVAIIIAVNAYKLPAILERFMKGYAK
jgi:uncharacterized membrane protein YfcA